MDRATARLCSKYLSYGLPFLYLLTSIAFYLHTYDSAQVKITIVQMLGISLMGVWYLKLLCEWEIPFKRYATIVAPLLACLASGLFSFSHAAYRGPSLDECLRRVFYIHFALIALTEINTVERLKRMVSYLLLATVISVVYGLMEMLDYRFFPLASFPTGIDPFIWRQAFGSRIFSTFGNPNFFGNFLVILTPITLALLLKRNRERPISVLFFAVCAIGVSASMWKIDVLSQLHHALAMGAGLFAFVIAIRLMLKNRERPRWELLLRGVGCFAFAIVLGWVINKITHGANLEGLASPAAFYFILLGAFMLWSAIQFSFLGIIFFLITLCNILTVSKGAWVGYTAGFIAFIMLVLFYFSQFQSDKMRRALKTGALVMLAFGAIGVGVVSLQRVDSLRFRVCTWVSTFEMGNTHPIIGNGIGSFRVLYPAYRRPQIFHIEGKHNTETDHAEDEYWEVFQDEGIIGFGIFIWVIVTFSVMGVRSLQRFTEGLSYKDPSTGKRKYSEDPRAYYMLGILAAFWGMLIHNAMDVSLRFVSSGIFLWLLAGLIGAMTIHDPMREKDLPVNPEAEPAPPAPSPIMTTMTMVLRLITLGLFGILTYYVLIQFADTQGAYPEPFGEALLWLIAWVSVAGTVAACLWVFFQVGRSLRPAHGFLIFWAMLYPLWTCWGYFMADVHHNRGIFFSKQGKWDEALANYDEVVRLNPNYIMAYYFMGNVYTDRWHPGDFENSMHEYERAWSIAPNYVQSHHQAGLVYLKKGADDKNEADRLHAAGQNGPAIQKLAEVENDWKQALVYFQKYHDIDPVFEPNYVRMAWVDLQLADLAHMRGDNALAEKYRDTAELAYKESLGAWICGAPENDVMHEHWSATHRHFSEEMFENLGSARFMRGRVAEAARAFKMAAWVDPTSVRALKNMALCYSRLGDNTRALHAWQQVRQVAPNDPDLKKVFPHS